MGVQEGKHGGQLSGTAEQDNGGFDFTTNEEREIYVCEISVEDRLAEG